MALPATQTAHLATLTALPATQTALSATQTAVWATKLTQWAMSRQTLTPTLTLNLAVFLLRLRYIVLQTGICTENVPFIIACCFQCSQVSSYLRGVSLIIQLFHITLLLPPPCPHPCPSPYHASFHSLAPTPSKFIPISLLTLQLIWSEKKCFSLHAVLNNFHLVICLWLHLKLGILLSNPYALLMPAQLIATRKKKFSIACWLTFFLKNIVSHGNFFFSSWIKKMFQAFPLSLVLLCWLCRLFVTQMWWFTESVPPRFCLVQICFVLVPPPFCSSSCFKRLLLQSWFLIVFVMSGFGFWFCLSVGFCFVPSC
jgi:hypothetical protein